MVSGGKKNGGRGEDYFVLKGWHLYQKQGLYFVLSCCSLFLQVLFMTILASAHSP